MAKQGRLTMLAVFAAASSVMAGFYINDARYVGRLLVGNQFFGSREGRACIGVDAAPEPWKVNISTLKTAKGQYLAYRAGGGDSTVFFADKESQDTDWTIHLVRTLKPMEARYSGRSEGKLYEGQEGLEFKLSAKHGPFAGWYLAEGTVDPGDKKSVPLVLVNESKSASVLLFVERIHRPIDKKSKK